MSTTGWVSATVPPGSETGQFYIPVGNLPFLVHWQDLKDWLRQVCDIDHVEVCGPTKGSGWIRVKGQKNFRRALHRLNTDPFQNRALIAQDLNRYLAIPICFPETAEGVQIPMEVENYSISSMSGAISRRGQERGGLHVTTSMPNPYHATAVNSPFQQSQGISGYSPPSGSGLQAPGMALATTPTLVAHVQSPVARVGEPGLATSPRVSPFDMRELTAQMGHQSVDSTGEGQGGEETTCREKNKKRAETPPVVVSSNPDWQDSHQGSRGDNKGKKRAETEPMVVSSDPRWIYANQGGNGLASDQIPPPKFGESSGRLHDKFSASPSSSTSSLHHDGGRTMTRKSASSATGSRGKKGGKKSSAGEDKPKPKS